MADPARRNIELKARDPDPERTLLTCGEIGARDHGLLDQRDTYFHAPRGRLKLREQVPGGAWLIAYDRADRPEERLSSYRLAAVSEPRGLREALDASLGIELTVHKRRRLLLWRSVRIHLDEVTGLGHFVELEAVAEPGSDLSAEHLLVAQLRTALGIADELLCGRGYAQLLADS